MSERGLRGYMVSSMWPEEGAVLVFDVTAREAKRRGWPIIVHDYLAAEEYTEIRVRWLRDADPKAWGVTEPTLLEPPGCIDCEHWYSEPNDGEGRCENCADEAQQEAPDATGGPE